MTGKIREEIRELGIMIIRKLAMILISIFFFAGPAFGELSIPQIADKYAPSVVSIMSLDENGQSFSSGSGFFINKEGDIVTNHHVLVGAVKAVIKTFEGKRGEIIEIIKDDPRLDLLVARTSLQNRIPLLLGDSDAIAVGEDIVALGNLAGLEGAISIGAISDVRKAEDIEFIQITAPISPGSSGGPVFSLNGKVIGIATAFLDLGPNLNLAMPVNYLKTLKPVRLKLGSLPRMTMKIEATVRGKTFVEVLGIRHGITNNAHPSPHNRGPDHGSYEPSVAGPGTVYFKNGKKLLCDRAWKDGSTIFLVIHGKKVAVGYDEREIDMERSFI